MVKRVKLKQLKDLMLRFGNSRQQFFFSQKRGSIAIEGAVCTLLALMFLGMLINLMGIFNQMLLSTRLTGNLAMSLFNGRNTNQAFLQDLVNQVMVANGVKGSSATVVVEQLPLGAAALRTFNYGAGCSAQWVPTVGRLEDIMHSFVQGGYMGYSSLPGVSAVAQVTVCVPPPAFYLNWAMLGVYTPQRQVGATIIAIPKPPKHK